VVLELDGARRPTTGGLARSQLEDLAETELRGRVGQFDFPRTMIESALRVSPECGHKVGVMAQV
jgi:hypothetical protein